MESKSEIVKPGETVILKRNTRCDIKCGTLKIERNVSFVGNVEADEIFVAGSFLGRMKTRKLHTGVHSNVRGDLQYGSLNAHRNAKPPQRGFVVDERKFEASISPAVEISPPVRTATRVLRLNF